jgi:hypothetical protein
VVFTVTFKSSLYYVDETFYHLENLDLLQTSTKLNRHSIFQCITKADSLFCDLVDRYGIFVSQMTTDMFHLS